MEPVKVLCIGGSDSSGGAGIQADLKAVSVCGCYGLSVITAVTAQNTQGVQYVYPVPQKFILAQLDSVLSDIGADAVKTGMLLTAGAVESVVKKVKEYRLEKLIVDPVMIAKGGRSLMQVQARNALVKKLLPQTYVLTPNIPEAEILAQFSIKTVVAMEKAAIVIHKLGARNVLIKGGHLPGIKKSGALDILFDGDRCYKFSAPWIDSIDTHGTGCTYASVLASALALRKNIVDAVWQAKDMVTTAIKNGLTLGNGHGSVNIFWETFLTKKRGQFPRFKKML
jgi:hydroxymethylpyrimidine kinase/phosphomethylpyrimidine kinase